MKRMLITGGTGFIGSHLVDHFCTTFPETHIIVLDKMTYAADERNIAHWLKQGRASLLKGDVADFDCCLKATKAVDAVIHAAAESHVDSSFGTPLLFTMSNVYGTHSLLEACRVNQVPRIVHVSTDEVYGEVLEGAKAETDRLNPTNPYAASKAAAEMILSGYRHSYGLPVMTVRANNVFGIRQYPEKIIPRFTRNLIQGHKLPIFGDGRHKRHNLAAQDMARALGVVLEKGTIGKIYNIGSIEEYSSLEIAQKLCRLFHRDPEDTIDFVQDRPFHDRRYAVQWDELAALGWRPEREVTTELASIVAWYQNNLDRFETH